MYRNFIGSTARFSYKQNFPFELPSNNDFSDILLQDTEISRLLHQKYLHPFQNSSKVAKGILYGAASRPMICLPVSAHNKKPLAIHFLLDTGSPTTLITKTALLAIFGVKDVTLIDSQAVSIWGTKLTFKQSSAHFEDINLLGADYLEKGELRVEIDYDKDPDLRKLTLLKKELL